MSAGAGQTTIGPVAAARLRTQTAHSIGEHDEQYTARPLLWSARENLGLAVAAVLVALMMLLMAQTMPAPGAQAALGETDETFVVDPDGTEPFIVCTDRAGVRRCTTMDLVPGQP
jgi:hypothetical protein